MLREAELYASVRRKEGTAYVASWSMGQETCGLIDLVLITGSKGGADHKPDLIGLLERGKPGAHEAWRVDLPSEDSGRALQGCSVFSEVTLKDKNVWIINHETVTACIPSRLSAEPQRLVERILVCESSSL